MILISHRGNINGPKPESENNPDYIKTALELGYDVEIDVWSKDMEFYLGHDTPKFKVEREFLQNPKLWCHAKNIDALYLMSNKSALMHNGAIHYFWHQNDDVTVTSKGYLWTLPGRQLTKKSICVFPEIQMMDLGVTRMIKSDCIGMCSDYVGKYYNEKI